MSLAASEGLLPQFMGALWTASQGQEVPAAQIEALAVDLPPSETGAERSFHQVARTLLDRAAWPSVPAIPRLWTQSPTTQLPTVTFNETRSEEASGLLLTEAQAALFLGHRAKNISKEDLYNYTRFVIDRLQPRVGLLRRFILPENTRSLQEALEFFVAVFQDEEQMEAELKTLNLASPETHPGKVVPPTLTDHMRWAAQDAAAYLFDLGKIEARGRGIFAPAFARFDPHRLPRKTSYDLATLDTIHLEFPELNDEALKALYLSALEQRLVTQRLLFGLSASDPNKTVPFLIEGAGVELTGLVTARAYADAVGAENVRAAPHYRSGGLVKGLVEAQGYKDFVLDSMRQALNRQTDPRSAGRDMGTHFDYPELGIYRTLSALAMNIAFPLGGALHEKIYGDGSQKKIFFAEIGDASLSTNEFHEFMEGASVQKLPVVLNILDNGVGISVRPEEGRGTTDLEALAKSKGFEFLTADGNDVLDVYRMHRRAAQIAQSGRRVITWTQNLPRLNDHSSSSGRSYKLNELDPLLSLSRALVDRGILRPEEALKRLDQADGSHFIHTHDLGSLGRSIQERVDQLFKDACEEPVTTVESVRTFSRIVIPDIQEPRPGEGGTQIPFNVGTRLALRYILEHYPSFFWGQDIAEPKGGIFQATAGLSHLFKKQVFNGPINEGLLAAMAAGFSMEAGAIGMFEIQFDDYALNILHRLEQICLMYWLSAGKRNPNVIMRVATEPVPTGAIYHSSSRVNYYTALPGAIVVSPSTTWDQAGLLLAAAQTPGLKIFLEPKILYREMVGPAFPGEPRLNADEVAAMKNRGWTPDLQAAPIPLGKAAVRRPLPEIPDDKTGLTLVSWGGGVRYALKAAEELSPQGIESEVIDLRTVMPWDQEAVLTSVHKTGALLVVHDGPTQAGLAEHIVATAMQVFQDDGVSSGARLGWDLRFGVTGWDPSVPAMPQKPSLNTAFSLNPARIVAAAKQVVDRNSRGSSGFQVVSDGEHAYRVVRG